MVFKKHSSIILSKVILQFQNYCAVNFKLITIPRYLLFDYLGILLLLFNVNLMNIDSLTWYLLIPLPNFPQVFGRLIDTIWECHNETTCMSDEQTLMHVAQTLAYKKERKLNKDMSYIHLFAKKKKKIIPTFHFSANFNKLTSFFPSFFFSFLVFVLKHIEISFKQTN